MGKKTIKAWAVYETTEQAVHATRNTRTKARQIMRKHNEYAKFAGLALRHTVLACTITIHTPKRRKA